MLVQALLAHPALAGELCGSVELEEIENEHCRAIVGKVVALLDRGGPDGLAGRLQFDDEQQTRMASAWLADPGPMAEESEARRAARECLARIRQRRQARESKLVQEQLCSPEAAANPELVKQLLAIKQGLRTPGTV
jgi:hypothetical protein